ncbi:DUF3370 domain-containing protein [Leptothermofonsia sichuanensis E412]|jgi:hypothetical protein|uniref:DUF3370 domain-containing protein n=1 Tax=Leptothermofonsia sichuanensis TaxID=2917832 RepID=UPI001CA6CCE0|nr:DUF3370 domain-containing protein [Leptothermofonsia sichuanensis]QZZ18617.1 DUF3370 domain-containing protein [Leptothermofonsia sichuanensis E412]
MFQLLSFITLAQTVSAPVVPPTLPPPPSRPKAPPSQEVIPPQERLKPQETLQVQEIFQPQELRALPGQLDTVPVFNSNSPEVVQTEGILLSTFPPDGMRDPSAHLNFPFKGRFDVFSHHIARARNSSQTRTLFQGIILYNPSDQLIKVDVLQGATYLTRPDALFVDLPSYVEDPLGKVYAGPGSRAMNDVLRGRKHGSIPSSLIIPPGGSQMLMNLPIPVGNLTPSSNGRSSLFRLVSSGTVYVASLAMFAPLNPDGTERIPTLDEWKALLVSSSLAGPRDIPPTPMQKDYAQVIYGRVAGVAVGSEWRANVTDNPKVDYLTIPKRGQAFSYGLSTLYRGTFGTGQIQSAKLLARYPDTAYQAHGNYGIQYSLTLPLYNKTRQRETVAIALQTPLKEDRAKGGLLFFQPPENRIFFRGPVRLRYTDDQGVAQTRYIHVIMQRGQAGEPLVVLNMPPGDRRSVQIDFLYPPDSTPPQVLTVKTLETAVTAGK